MLRSLVWLAISLALMKTVVFLQDTSVMTDDNGSDTSQFTGSTINLQDLE